MVLVEPNGKRALINYKGETKPLPEEAIDFSDIKPKVIVFEAMNRSSSVPLAKNA